MIFNPSLKHYVANEFNFPNPKCSDLFAGSCTFQNTFRTFQNNFRTLHTFHERWKLCFETIYLNWKKCEEIGRGHVMYTKTPPLPKLRNDTKLQNGAHSLSSIKFQNYSQCIYLWCTCKTNVEDKCWRI